MKAEEPSRHYVQFDERREREYVDPADLLSLYTGNPARALMAAMAAVSTHRDLHAWRESMALAEIVYRATESFPKAEYFGLVNQLRRCAISIPSNIAEGAGRNSTREFVQFLGISCGSLSELETQLELALRLGYLEPDSDSVRQLNRAGRIVRALRRSLREKVTAAANK
jgi:four helix bundle protein